MRKVVPKWNGQQLCTRVRASSDNFTISQKSNTELNGGVVNIQTLQQGPSKTVPYSLPDQKEDSTVIPGNQDT